MVCWWVRLGERFLCSPINDDEQQIHCLSFGHHIALSNVAPGMCVSTVKGWGQLTVHGDNVGCHQCQTTLCCWCCWAMNVVVKKEHCRLLMAPEFSITVCQHLLWA